MSEITFRRAKREDLSAVVRMLAEDDLNGVEPWFFSTTQAGRQGPQLGRKTPAVQDAGDMKRLEAMDIIISCQGGSYTEQIHPKLRADGWQGYWIDAASTLRMAQHSVIILDPVNKSSCKKVFVRSEKFHEKERVFIFFHQCLLRLLLRLK